MSEPASDDASVAGPRSVTSSQLPTRIDGESDAPAPGAGRPPPDAIGDFDIIGELGRGAMGVVYLARERSVDRRVALKVLPLHLAASGSAHERFRREARSVAALDHEGIVPVYRYGAAGDGQPFIAMKVVEGRSLGAILDDQVERVSPERAARLVAATARAIHHAHDRGILHRDIKPSNIMITPEDRALVMDFGLARDDDDATLTGTGDTVGTPAFMSPEQARALPLDRRSDVYSLGATLYEALTLAPPFRGAHGRAVMLQVVNEEPRWPRDLVPHLPAELDVIVRKAMAKRPDDRYRSAAELADDLERWLRGEPILARPIGGITRLGRWAWRHHRALAAGIVAAATMGAAVVAVGVGAGERARAGALAEQLAEVDGALEEGGARGVGRARDLLGAVSADAPEGSGVAERRARLEMLTATVVAGELERARAAIAERDRADLGLLAGEDDPVALRAQARAAISEALDAARAVLRLDPDEEEALRIVEAFVTGSRLVNLSGIRDGMRVDVRRFDEDDWRPTGAWEPVDLGGASGELPVAARLPTHGVLRVSGDGLVETRLPYRSDAFVLDFFVLPLPAPIPASPELEGMVRVPAGPCLLGGNARGSASGSATEEMVEGFLIDRTEVTVARFAAFVAAGGYGERRLWSDAGWAWRRAADVDGPDPTSVAGSAELPVVGINRHEADAFARWAGRRLPTEREWEKAARGTDGRLFPWGNARDAVGAPDALGAPGANAGDESPFGCLDMGRNAMEWTASAPASNAALAIVRGGAFSYDPRAGRSRCAAREALAPEDRQPFVGFRTAKDLP